MQATTAHRLAQDRISATLYRAVLAALVGPTDPRELGADELTRRAASGVISARDASYRVSLDLADMLSAGSFREVGPPLYTIRFLTAAFTQVLRSPDHGPAAIAARAVRHAEQAGRETQVAIARTDPRSGRWARLGHGDTCRFCTMLISRGFVYGERSVAFRAHDNCRCTAAAQFGEDPELAAEVEGQRQAALERYIADRGER